MNFKLFLTFSIFATASVAGATNRIHPLFGEEAAQVTCEDYLSDREPQTFPAELIRISFGLGSSVEEVARVPSVLNPKANLLWLAPHAPGAWSARWNTHDLSGDARWGHDLLGGRALAHGFMMRRVGSDQNYSLPDVEMQNWSIEKYDKENPFRVLKSNGAKSAKEVLEGLSKGKIFADVTRSRAFLHHTNYHFVSLLLLKTEVLSAIKRRAGLVLKFGQFTGARARSYDEQDDLLALDMFYQEAASRFDLIANVVPMFAAIEKGDIETARKLANEVRHDMSSISDSIFIIGVAQTVAQEAPLGRTRFTPDIRTDLEKFKEKNPGLVLDRDPQLYEFGMALRNFADTGDLKELFKLRKD